MSIEVECINSISRLKAITKEWDELARQTYDSNIFFESWFLIPAFLRLPSSHVEVLVVWDKSSARPKLLYLMPIIPIHKYKRMPVSALKTWNHDYCFCGAPLVHQNFNDTACLAVTSYIESSQSCVLLVENVPTKSPALRLQDVANSRMHTSILSYEYERACIDSQVSGEDYINSALSKKKLKELNRIKRRLAEQGELSFERFQANHDNLEEWIEVFLELEDSGWKGESQTSLRYNSDHKAFFEEIVHGASSRNQLEFYRLKLAGKTIANLVIFVGNRTISTFKICYDESFQKFSPGVLLMIEVTESLLDNYPNSVIDSCAVENHPMINRLWKERKSMATLEISANSIIANTLMSISNLRNSIRKRVHL